MIRDKILKAAAFLFSKKGFDGTSAETIARRAGVSKASIFYHFGSKKKLYVKVLEKVLQPFLKDFIRKLEEIDDPQEFIMEVANSYLNFISRRKGLIPIIVRDMLDGGRNFTSFLAGIMESTGIKEKAQEKFRRWREEGLVRDLPFHQVMIHLFSMLYFPFIAEPAIKRIFNIDTSSEEFLRERRKAICEILMHGILGGRDEKGSSPDSASSDAAGGRKGIS